jgi:hypothetical protein
MRTEKLPMASRLLRVREFTDQVSKKTAKKTGGKGKSRFVDPCHFGTEDKAALVQLLTNAGIGDEEGRRLFVTAVEFEVGGLRPALQKEAETEPSPPPVPVVEHPPSKAHIELLQLAQSAAQFKSLLENTHKSARRQLCESLNASDPFGREHGTAYLEHLTLELGRISVACSAAETVPATEPATPKPVIGEAAAKLIGQVARIYDECLEADPRDNEAHVLIAVLRLIRDCTELPIPCDDQAVRELLG